MRKLFAAVCIAFFLVAALFGTTAAQEISQDPLYIVGSIAVTPVEYNIYASENTLTITYIVTNTGSVTVETEVRFHIMAAPEYSRQPPEFVTNTLLLPFDNVYLNCPATETCSGRLYGVLPPGISMGALIHTYPSTRMGMYVAADGVFIERYLGVNRRADGQLIIVTPKVYTLFPLILK